VSQSGTAQTRNVIDVDVSIIQVRKSFPADLVGVLTILAMRIL
jgi:hypothetical protein